MNLVERIERENMKKALPNFRIGDSVKVHVKVVEGDKERIQVFEGIVIGRDGSRNRETFTVRKISYGVGVERIFPVHSPKVEKIDVVRSNRVHRAKLYYLRGRSGKAARFVEKERYTARKPAAVPAEQAAEVKQNAEAAETPQES